MSLCHWTGFPLMSYAAYVEHEGGNYESKTELSRTPLPRVTQIDDSRNSTIRA
jgi:hypothetical protein